MKHKLLAFSILPLLFASCTIRNGEVDATSWVQDRITAQQDDRVILEAGHATAPADNRPAFATGAAVHSAPSVAGGSVYTVRKGDTLSGIAARHHTTAAAIRRANGLSSDKIAIGKKLTIPRGGSRTAATTHQTPLSGGSRYIVKKGDTVSAVARRYRLSTAALLKANGLTPASASALKPGAVLRIPAHR